MPHELLEFGNNYFFPCASATAHPVSPEYCVCGWIIVPASRRLWRGFPGWLHFNVKAAAQAKFQQLC
jgi:hypothetical protein